MESKSLRVLSLWSTFTGASKGTNFKVKLQFISLVGRNSSVNHLSSGRLNPKCLAEFLSPYF